MYSVFWLTSWRQIWKDLGSTAETRMKGYPVILNRLILCIFGLKCKDERRKRNDRISERKGNPICLYMKNMPSFLKKVLEFLENIPSFFENIKVFLQHSVWAAYFFMRMYASVYTYGGIGLHVYTHKPTRTYASGYTYVRISLYIYYNDIFD